MPLVIHPRVRRGAARLAAATSVAMFACSGAALADTGLAPAPASCPAQSTTQAFLSLGDANNYFPVPDGTLSDPTLPGWTLSNAALTPGGDPFQINGIQSTSAVTIQSGGWVQTASFCVDNTMPTFRFSALESSSGSPLSVQIVGTAGSVTGQLLNLASLPDGSAASWTAEGPVSLTGGLTVPAGQTYSAALRFKVPAGGGAWKIDDIYVDPYRVG